MVLYGDFMLFYGFGFYVGSFFGYGFFGRFGLFWLKILSDKFKIEFKKEEKVISWYFIYNFYLGRMGWGGVLYLSYGYCGVFFLLGVYFYGFYVVGYYGFYGFFCGLFGFYLRLNVFESMEESF